MPSRPCPALLLVDLQHDFLPPSGALAVPHGDAVLEDAVYPLLDRGKWNLVAASQDFHPPGHISFASRHQLPTFSRTTVSHPLTQEPIDQELWPNHCVQGTRGCEFDEGVEQRLERLRTERGEQFVRVIQKAFSDAYKVFSTLKRLTVPFCRLQQGVDRDLDAYSAFAVPLAVPGASSRSADPSEGGATSAELTRVLLDSGITHLVIVGLALDFCVLASALAAKRASAAHGDRWEVWVVREGTRAVSADKEEAVFERMRSEGIKVVNMKDDELRQWTRDSE